MLIAVSAIQIDRDIVRDGLEPGLVLILGEGAEVLLHDDIAIIVHYMRVDIPIGHSLKVDLFPRRFIIHDLL